MAVLLVSWLEVTEPSWACGWLGVRRSEKIEFQMQMGNKWEEGKGLAVAFTLIRQMSFPTGTLLGKPPTGEGEGVHVDFSGFLVAHYVLRQLVTVVN